jgi:hypothetical protein
MRNPWFLVLVSMIAIGLLLGRFSRFEEPGAAREAAWAASLHKAKRAVVSVAVVDLLAQPAASSSVVDQAVVGETVAVLQHGGPYVQVETAARYRGYVRATALSALAEGAPDYGRAKDGEAVVVVSRFANLYAEPDVTVRAPVLVAPLGARLEVGPGKRPGEQNERWLPIRLPDGQVAHIQRGDVTPAGAPRLTGACVTEHALRHEGTPYLWGGRSTFGVDCSGLVSNAFIACGVVPPRDADQQHGWAELVDAPMEGLRPGDLIFFGGRPGGQGQGNKVKVTHVGISLGGDLFVHATTSERPTVHQSRLGEGRWRELLVGAKRHPRME